MQNMQNMIWFPVAIVLFQHRNIGAIMVLHACVCHCMDFEQDIRSLHSSHINSTWSLYSLQSENQNMQNMFWTSLFKTCAKYAQYAEYAEYDQYVVLNMLTICTICRICRICNMTNMSNMQIPNSIWTPPLFIWRIWTPPLFICHNMSQYAIKYAKYGPPPFLYSIFLKICKI